MCVSRCTEKIAGRALFSEELAGYANVHEFNVVNSIVLKRFDYLDSLSENKFARIKINKRILWELPSAL